VSRLHGENHPVVHLLRLTIRPKNNPATRENMLWPNSTRCLQCSSLSTLTIHPNQRLHYYHYSHILEVDNIIEIFLLKEYSNSRVIENNCCELNDKMFCWKQKLLYLLKWIGASMNMNCAMTITFLYLFFSQPHQKLLMLDIPQKGEIFRRTSMEKRIGKSVTSMDGLHRRKERHGGGREN